MDNVDEEADDIYNGILGEIGLEYEIADPVRRYTMLIDINSQESKEQP